MSLDDNLRALERTPVLSEIGRDALRLLAFSAESIRLAAGEALFARGDEADCAYSVVSGRVELTGDGESRVVGPGALIGETALIVPTQRPCDAVAADAARLLVIPRPTFLKMLQEYPDIARALRARLIDRMREEFAALEQIRASLDRLPGA